MEQRQPKKKYENKTLNAREQAREQRRKGKNRQSTW